MIRIRLCGSILLALLVSPAFARGQEASAAPFGIRVGMPYAEVIKLGDPGKTPGTFALRKMPQPHPDFESLIVVASRKHGACKVVAIGNTLSTSAYGDDVRSTFRRLSEALSSKYGAPDLEFDFLRAGSIWNEPRDWMMGLQQEERTLANAWGDPENGKEVGNGISVILLQANALSASKGYINVTYDFASATECLKSIQAEADAIM